MPYFSNKFKRQKTPDGKMSYWFYSEYSQLQNESNYNEKPPLAVDGETIESEEQMDDSYFNKLPEETRNPNVLKNVFTQWIADCSGAFVKPPTIEQCLNNFENIWDSNAPIASLNPSEEEDTWTLQWVPTKVKVEIPVFQIYWAPSYKIKATRIPEFKEGLEDGEQIELQTPNGDTRLITAKPTEWLQEIQDGSIPFSDTPALRLDIGIDAQRDKLRRRVREARIRAKLALYRAERLAHKYEDRYGVYPEEDDEEAQTEAEQSDLD